MIPILDVTSPLFWSINYSEKLSNIKNIADQEDFIKAKILEANMLIDRVKDTLCDIKNKSKRDNQKRDKHTVSDDSSTSQMCYEPPCCESTRPKTRRPLPCQDKSDTEDKFKNTICENLEATDSLEVLQSKLNTIIEQAESDSMSSSESKDHEEVKVVSTGVQIEEKTIPQQSSAVQVGPNLVSTGVQITNTETNTATTQTDRQPKKLCLETNCVVTIPAATPKLCKMDKLNIQHMPPINIKRKLVVQRVLKFYIDDQGITYFIPQSKEKNNRFFEMTHAHPQANLKIRFEKELLRNILRGPSSELSVFLPKTAVPYSRPSMGLHGSVSDGELITIRKNQLKKSIQPQTADKLESLSKELILKSFHIYDNPNVHDPGETQLPANVGSIDTFVYKTFINPDGLPNAASININRPWNMITPETLQKISQHKSVRNQLYATDSKKMLSLVTPRTRHSVSMEKKPLSRHSPINIYDLGLYSAKSTQVETSSFPTSTVPTLPKPEVQPEPTMPEKTSSPCDKNTNTSFEKISITLSYSSEETVSSDPTSEHIIQHRNSEDIQDHEIELKTVEPTQPYKSPDLLISKGSQDTFQMLKEKFAREGYKESATQEVVSPQTLSAESTIPQFIMSLTQTPSHHIKKLLPHIRKNVTGSVAEKQSKSNTEQSVSSNKLNDSSQDSKSKPKPKRPKKDFTVLSMQIHGDCVPNDSDRTNSPLKLAKNGRYKDEEDLFCEDRPKLTNLPLRRRALKHTPVRAYPNKYALDSSSGDAVSMEASFSEGEIKCHGSASIGEVRRRPHFDNVGRIRQKMTNAEPNVIRERRTYFNHWITYYVNKNARIPLLSHSSSTSST